MHIVEESTGNLGTEAVEPVKGWERLNVTAAAAGPQALSLQCPHVLSAHGMCL